jgi:hypothetical protein
MKKIVKIITFYDDGTFDESTQIGPSMPTVVPLKSLYNVCPKCNINLRDTMCYSCKHNDCPTGLGSSFSVG